MMGHLQPVEDLLNSDSIRYHRPTGTAELYSAVGDAESILQRNTLMVPGTSSLLGSES